MTDSQKWLLFAGIAATGWLLYLLAPVITPFLTAALLAYLCDPPVNRLAARMPRTLAVSLVFLLLLAAFLVMLLILIPLLQEQILLLIQRLPEFIVWAQQTVMPSIGAALGIDFGAISLDAIRDTLVENWRNVGSVAGSLFSSLGSSGQAVMAWLAFIVLIPVVTFYLLCDWHVLLASLRALIPRRHAGTVIALIVECDRVLSEFLRGQLLVMLVLALIYATGLWLVGVEFALLIGIAAGMISFVPYLGSIIGILIAGTVAFMQYQDLIHLFYVLLVFGVGQMLEGMLLSPWLVGDRIGLHPVAVIFAVLAGGQLFGFVGVLLALPAAAVILVLLRYLVGQYKLSRFYA